jgi:uncharacterized protein involved in exopolysaccharide biosynthesis
MSQSIEDDEIDLRELFAVLISGWFTIGVSTAIALVVSIFYALFISVEKYESISVFALNDIKSSSLPAGLSGLAGLAGISMPSSGGASDRIEDIILSREFLLETASKLDLWDDPDFAPDTDANSQGSIVRELLPFLRGFGKSEAEQIKASNDLQAKLRQDMYDRLSKALAINTRESGVIEISCKDTSPERAARIVNAIVDEVIFVLETQEIEGSRSELQYLETELLRVQEELEQAAQALQKYALSSNIGSMQDLTKSSLRLENLRDQRASLLRFYDALASLWAEKNWTDIFLDQTRESYPFVTSLEFRRLLLLGPNLGDWQRPDDAILRSARENIGAQISDLDLLIREGNIRAERAADQAYELAFLERNVKVKETLYEVLVKQFEANSLTSGLPGKVARIYERGVPAVYKSEPNRKLILALGLVLGSFVGAALVLARSSRSGRIMSRGSLRDSLVSEGNYVEMKYVRALGARSLATGLAKLGRYGGGFSKLSSFVPMKTRVICLTSSGKAAHARSTALQVTHLLSAEAKAFLIIDIGSLWSSEKLSEKEILPNLRVKYRMLDGGNSLMQVDNNFDPRAINQVVELYLNEEHNIIIVGASAEQTRLEIIPTSDSVEQWITTVDVKHTTRQDLSTMQSLSDLIGKRMTFVSGV